MPGINVSALSGGDLRRLLKVAHARHDGLLADRLEWEIAARATSGGRPSVSFARPHQEEDEEEPAELASVADAEPLAPEPTEKAPRGVALVTLGAIAGSLLSASVFWGLERLDMRQPFARTEPQATPAMAPAAPVAEQLVEELMPATLPPAPQPLALEAPPAVVETALPVATPRAETARPQPVAPEAAPPPAIVETALPVAAPRAETARKAAPSKTAQKKADAPVKAALKKDDASVKTAQKKPAPRATTLTVAKAEGPPRPPTLSEWLKSKPDEPGF